MSFWIVVGAMAVASVAALALPLFRSRVADTDPAEFDLEVYRDQIAELERDHERGVLSDTEMEAARTEIARRILAANARLKARTGEDVVKGGRSLTLGIIILASALAVALPLGALSLYLDLGRPDRPDMPLASRTDLAPEQQNAGIDRTIARLEQATQEDPTNPDAWASLGLAYKRAQRFHESADALAKAFSLRPATPMLNSEYGESLVLATQGTVTTEARAAFEAALAERPDDIRANYYLALADYQAGHTQDALDRWSALIAKSPADAPWLSAVRENLTRAAEDLGLDVAEVMPEPQPPEQGDGLTAEQRAELEAMSPEEREATIRNMVDGLESRLAENPMDLEGWENLIRARHVMGDRDAAQAALDRALETFSKAPVPKQRLAKLAHELGLKAPAAPGEADIAGMVQRLADRMKQNPDDLDGWLMLARSYTVMGDSDKARDAMANAVRLAPDDPRVLALQAAAIRQANGGRSTPESTSIMRRVLKIDPNHTEALWYVGNAEAEAGNTGKAIEMLERAYQQIPDDSAEKAFVRKRIDEIRGG